MLLSTSQRDRAGTGCLSFGLTSTKTSAADLDPQAEGRAFSVVLAVSQYPGCHSHTCAVKLQPYSAPLRSMGCRWGEGEGHRHFHQNRDCTPHTHVHPAGKSLSFAAAQVPHQPLPLSRVLLPCCLIFPLLLSNIRAQEEEDCTEGLSQNHPSPSTAKGPWLLSFSFSPDASPRYHQHFGPEVALLTQYFSVGAPSFKLQVIFWLRMF